MNATCILLGLLAVCALVLGTQAWSEDAGAAPWFVPVPNWKAPAPGEHPRLFFRKGDIPALRKRAETLEGQAMLARLRLLLGGGDALPQEYNKTPKGYSTDASSFPLGIWTLWHMSGYGFLHVITGDPKYAALARECVELALQGRRDRDDRYAFNAPSSEIRAGPSLEALALAYDFCYDAWPEDFRKKIALEIQNFNKRGDKAGSSHLDMSLEQLCLRPNMAPGSNHFPPQVGGAIISVLAIENDPGSDAALLKKYRDGMEKNLIRALTEGWGDYGYFAEGQMGPGTMNLRSFVPSLQALRVAGGRDYLVPRPNAQWVSLHYVLELLKTGPVCRHPSRTKAPGSYGTEVLDRKGEFCEGFGSLANEDQRAAMLWVYRNFVEPGEVEALKKDRHAQGEVLKAGEKSYDAIVYPHHAVYAFVNWPVGVQPRNPGEVIPRAVFDSIHNHLACRNQWKDENDILVTALLGKGPGGPYKVSGGPVKVWGLGLRLDLGGISGAAASEPPLLAKDGSAAVCFTEGAVKRGLLVDFGRSSGADAVVILPGAGKPAEGKGPGGSARTTQVETASGPVLVLTLATGAQPEVKAAGDAITVGTAAYRWTEGKISFAKPPAQ